MGNWTGTNLKDAYAKKMWWGAVLTMFSGPFFPIGCFLFIAGWMERRRVMADRASGGI